MYVFLYTIHWNLAVGQVSGTPPPPFCGKLVRLIQNYHSSASTKWHTEVQTSNFVKTGKSDIGGLCILLLKELLLLVLEYWKNGRRYQTTCI